MTKKTMNELLYEAYEKINAINNDLDSYLDRDDAPKELWEVQQEFVGVLNKVFELTDEGKQWWEERTGLRYQSKLEKKTTNLEHFFGTPKDAICMSVGWGHREGEPVLQITQDIPGSPCSTVWSFKSRQSAIQWLGDLYMGKE